MKNSIKKCKKCGNFFDIENINYCLNVAISEKLEENPDNEILLNLISLMNERTNIKWCTCFSEEKTNLIKEAEAFLEKEKKEEIKMGFDFELNEDILYIANKNNFQNIHLLQFVKSLKAKLKDSEIFKFDFIDYDKLTDKYFEYKQYYSSPNYLLIFDFELLQETNITQLIQINSIIKQRKTNNKKTFVVSREELKELEKILITRFYTKDEHIVLEFINLIKDTFKHKKITTLKNKKEDVVIKTTQIRKPIKKQIKQQPSQELEL